MPTILVTGATGFIGAQLCRFLVDKGFRVRRAVRNLVSATADGSDVVAVGEIDSSTQWDVALHGVESVIHLAARAHVLGDSPANDIRYFECNSEGTRQLAEAAARAGVRQFIFLSSIKVNGEISAASGFTPFDQPNPMDAYGRSKWLAEQYLNGISAQTGMRIGIVRPPLVYGPGVRANFLRLLRLVDREYPLPLRLIDNRRALVSIWNLCDLLTTLVTDARASDHVWLVSDPEQLSTPALIRRIAAAMHRRSFLVPVPVSMLRIAAMATGNGAAIERLSESLAVDPKGSFSHLGWAPPLTVDEGISRTVSWYLAESSQHAH